MDRLPGDLILDILVRLPFKDVLRSKILCKTCYNLVSHPSFAAHYAANSPFTAVLAAPYFGSCSSSVFLLEFDGEFAVQTTLPLRPSPPLPPLSSLDSVTVIGSFNGVFFFVLNIWTPNHQLERVYASNPARGVCTQVVPEDTTCHRVQGEENDGYMVVEYKLLFRDGGDGLGVFKLLKLVFDDNGTPEAKIFSVRKDKNWRTLQDPFLFHSSRGALDDGVVVDGSYYWFLMHDHTYWIARFHFTHERGGLFVKLPQILQPCQGFQIDYTITESGMHLRELNNRLSVVDTRSNSRITIWTFEEADQSWSTNVLLMDWSLYDNLTPFVVSRNGNVLLTPPEDEDDSVVLFNPKTNQQTVMDCINAKICNAIAYAPTFR